MLQQEVKKEIRRQKKKKRIGCFALTVVLGVVFISVSAIKDNKDKKEDKPDFDYTSLIITEATTAKKSAPVTDAPVKEITEKVTEEVTEEITEVITEVVTEEENLLPLDDISLVDPEFKALMDEYESFYDDYIAFMKKYNSDIDNMLSMLNDYTNMMEKLNDWTKRIDDIDPDSLTPADNAYYLLVNLRIEKKLTENLL